MQKGGSREGWKENGGLGRERVGEENCAVLQILLKSSGPGPSLSLTQIDAPVA